MRVIARAVILLMFGASYASHGHQFNLYIGDNYIADSTVIAFEQLCHCNLMQNYFNDNEEMLAKMVSGGASGYNVIVATNYAVDELSHMNKILAIDLSRLPNIKNVNKKFIESHRSHYVHGVPYAYTPVFLAYNKDKLDELHINPNSWAVIFDEKYLKKLKDHVTVFNSSRNVFAAALLYLGKDPNSTKISDINMAKALIDKASPYWLRFDSDSYYRGILRGDIWLAMSYSIDIYKAKIDAASSHVKVNIGQTLQKEGNMYEMDNMVIPISTPDINASYDFINYVLSNDSQFDLAASTAASITADKAIARLPDDIKGADWIYPKHMNKMHTFKAFDVKTRVTISEMWTEIQMRCVY
jgi:spermidine/putrescine transport system substrate-binding protein